MPPLKYHSGQLSIQDEAQTSMVARQLAHWVGPVAEYAQGADMILLATVDMDNVLSFSVLSGKPPLVELRKESDGLHLYLPSNFSGFPPLISYYGGLVINLTNARRARVNGRLMQRDHRYELETNETFTLCKKYIAPTIALEDRLHFGPVSREPIALTDQWLIDRLANAETAFFASLSPESKPDVAHRGGPRGFLQLNPESRQLTWNEYVGDGVFKSAGNLRVTNKMTLLIPDLETGDGIELIGHGDYQNLRESRKQRIDPLVQHHEDFPIQGVITCEIDHAVRLRGLLNPRKRLEHAIKITSRSSIAQQAPH